MRAVSELVSAIALLLIALFASSMVVAALAPRIKLISSESIEAYQSIRINNTHAICYAFTSIDAEKLREMGVSVWVFVDGDRDGWNETVPVYNGTIPAGSYYVASPPICG